jgi:hypothetical protein
MCTLKEKLGKKMHERENYHFPEGGGGILAAEGCSISSVNWHVKNVLVLKFNCNSEIAFVEQRKKSQLLSEQF